jgi:hypothetical protein
MLHRVLRSMMTSIFVLFLASPGQADTSQASIHIVDFTPRFVAFYELAVEEDDPDRRFELWKAHYDFVALPPGLPDRDERARKMLDAAWPKYPDVMERIRPGVSALSPAPAPMLEQVAELLEAEDSLPPIALLYYVGMLEDNAFFAPQPDGTLVVALPAEMDEARRETIMAHEFVHAVHHALSDLTMGPDGSVANLVFSEGIAMQATRAMLPDKPDHKHLGGERAWQDKCHERISDVLADMPELLDHAGPEHVNRFTMGEGTSGLEREGYCAGWYLVGHLLDEGSTLAELARVPEREVAELLRQAIANL